MYQVECANFCFVYKSCLGILEDNFIATHAHFIIYLKTLLYHGKLINLLHKFSGTVAKNLPHMIWFDMMEKTLNCQVVTKTIIKECKFQFGLELGTSFFFPILCTTIMANMPKQILL
jgi:hypothetical protein